jgi:hypothetical protein
MKRGEQRRDRGKERPVEKTTEARRDRGGGEEISQWANRWGSRGRGSISISAASDKGHPSIWNQTMEEKMMTRPSSCRCRSGI